MQSQSASLLFCWKSINKVPCRSWARKPWETWESLGDFCAIDMRAFGLQGVGGREEHIIFNGKQAAKEIGRETIER